MEKSTFDIHLKYSQTCRDANPQVFKCGKCVKVFTTLINLQQHIRRHEKNNHSKHFQNNKCFTQNEDLQEHSHVHSTVHPCDGQEQNCPKTSLKPHAGEKCLQCEYCSKTFKFKSKLKRHLLVHTGEKPYKCQYCSKSFRQKDSFNYHLLTQHAGKKPYCCQHCSKSFPLLSRLQYHLRTHTGEKPYKCEYCNKSFACSSSLRLHVRTHTGEKPYRCKHCRKSFSDPSSFRRHKRTHNHYGP